jgi:hypothetical protein
MNGYFIIIFHRSFICGIALVAIMNYSFLNQPLQEWLDDKWASFTSHQDQQLASLERWFTDGPGGRTREQQLHLALGIEKDEFNRRYIHPWRGLTNEQLEGIVCYWNRANRFDYGQEIILRPIKELTALQWAITHVWLLNLKGLTVFQHTAADIHNNSDLINTDNVTKLFWSAEHCLPYKQCFYCGKLDKDERGFKFGKQKRRFCHHSECASTSDNLNDHHDRCCARQWNNLKRATRRTLNNNTNDAETVERKFIAFCDKRLEYGLELSIAPRPKIIKEPLPLYKNS